MFARDPKLPNDWLNQAIHATWDGPDAEWARACQQVLRRHVEQGIALEDVQTMVLRAVGIVPDASIRNEKWIAAIPHHEWATATAWGEPGRRALGNGTLWETFQSIRAIDDELGALIKLADMGVTPIQCARPSGVPDWQVQRNGHPLHVEVKSKGAEGLAVDFLKCALDGVLLAAGAERLRAYGWDLTSESNAVGIQRWTERENRVDALVQTLFDVASEISRWEESRMRRFDDCVWNLDRFQTRVRALLCDEVLEIKIEDVIGGGEFCFYGETTSDSAGPWLFSPVHVKSGTNWSAFRACK